MPTIQTPQWYAEHPAVQREMRLDSQGSPVLAGLSHAAYPHRAAIDPTPARRLAELGVFADDYLRRAEVLEHAGAPRLARARGLLGAGNASGFAWLPLDWDATAACRPGTPVSSFVVGRDAAAGVADRTVVLLAGNRRPASGDTAAEGLGVGLAVVMHVGEVAGGSLPVRITGLAASELARAADPADVFEVQLAALLGDAAKRDALKSAVRAQSGFSVVGLHGLSRGEGPGFVAHGSGTRPDGRAIEWSWAFEFAPGGLPLGRGPVRVELQASDAALPVSLLLQDPASAGPADSITERRVTREPATLSAFRKPALVANPLVDARWEVRQSRLADPLNDPTQPQTLAAAPAELRSDPLAAAHAWQRGRELFGLIDRLGLATAGLFRFARLPLVLRPRAGFDSRPDGNVVRAQVLPCDGPLAYLEPASVPPQLEVRFGAASLRHRTAGPDDHGRANAQPLGLAADPRWAWHEFGHVLGFAATGVLEFHFAHGVGDALAALLCDPDSQLGDPPQHPARGDTYPWVPAGRRHDRDVLAGWCWCGRMNGARRAPLVFPPRLRKGYVEEQLLSTSLFRLYRAIGGDDPGAASRRRAADAVALLVLRALMLAGPAGLVPIASAGQFVALLVAADAGSVARTNSDDVQGGCLHKALRWAFERQGLYADTDDPTQDVEGPGRPPAVDLWIADRRPGAAGAAADGGYEPVQLVFDEAAGWLAAPQVMGVQGGQLEVTVQHRGRDKAENLTLDVWTAGEAVPPFTWTRLGSAALAELPAGGQCTLAVPWTAAPGARHWALASVGAAGDLANLDPATGLPCSGTSPPAQQQALIDLVANDNNLALARLAA
jgi:hypothetical protein